MVDPSAPFHYIDGPQNHTAAIAGALVFAAGRDPAVITERYNDPLSF
jgi:hypothetical protein